MTTIREIVEERYPDAAKSHTWVPEYDDDNIECADCSVRPYNEDAKRECVDPYEATVATYDVADRDAPF